MNSDHLDELLLNMNAAIKKSLPSDIPRDTEVHLSFEDRIATAKVDTKEMKMEKSRHQNSLDRELEKLIREHGSTEDKIKRKVVDKNRM